MILHHFSSIFRELPKLSAHEEEGVHQNPQYTGQHHFHPVPHDHDYCERVVINVSKYDIELLLGGMFNKNGISLVIELDTFLYLFSLGKYVLKICC